MATHHDVFVCHSSEDKAVADAVVATLEHGGVRCWIAPRDVTPGASWAVDILRGIRDATVVVFVLSSHSNASPHVSRELERAVSEGLVVLPLRIEDVLPSAEIEYFISSAHWLDAMTPPLQAHLDRLLDTVRFLLADRRAGADAVSVGVPTPATPLPVPAARRASRVLVPVAAAIVFILLALGVAVAVVTTRSEAPSTTTATSSSVAPTTVATTDGAIPEVTQPLDKLKATLEVEPRTPYRDETVAISYSITNTSDLDFKASTTSIVVLVGASPGGEGTVLSDISQDIGVGATVTGTVHGSLADASPGPQTVWISAGQRFPGGTVGDVHPAQVRVIVQR
jgi:hypothetical protein